MRIGIPKEIKIHEYRVGLVPSSVRELIHSGHEVFIERGAGVGAGITDEAYTQVGARIADSGQEIFSTAELLIKVKEPQPSERKMLRPGQVLFTYFHLAPDPEQARDLQRSGATCIAYETVTAPDGSLPLLTPMSEVAGRMAPQVGASCLEKFNGGRGILLGGAAGVPPAEVLILGAGVVGWNAAMIAAGMGANVTLVDRSMVALRRASDHFGSSVRTIFSTPHAVEKLAVKADLLIGAVLVAGAATPKLVTAEMVKAMTTGAVIVDVSIDQGGCFETSRPTTHAQPTYLVNGVVHYCVTNMPGAVARTSTFALNNATLPFVLALANKGWKKAMGDDPNLRTGLNIWEGKITHPAVAEALGQPYTPAVTVTA